MRLDGTNLLIGEFVIDIYLSNDELAVKFASVREAMKVEMGAGQAVQWLPVLVALVENLSLVLNSQLPVAPAPGYLTPSSDRRRYPHPYKKQS